MKKIYLSKSHEASANIDHLLGNRDNLNKSPKGGEIQAIVSDYTAIKLEINAKSGKTTGLKAKPRQHEINIQCMERRGK